MQASNNRVLYTRGANKGKTALAYKFRNDVLFKMLFVQNPELLRNLVARILGIEPESIQELIIKNPEMPPEVVGGKFCRLDISMKVDGRNVVLEIQVEQEAGFKDRATYYLVREHSLSLHSGERYTDIPQTFIINIVGFRLFECDEYYSEFLLLEKARHERLTDNINVRFFELPKLPDAFFADDALLLWLSLFAADTEEELAAIRELEVPVMDQAIDAYREVTATDAFKEIERTLHYAALNEATQLGFAREEGYREAEEKWQGVVAEMQGVVAEQAALIEKLRSQLTSEA